MRILHLIYDHPANPWVGGGGARRTEIIGKGLAKRGHQVRLVCGRYPGAESVTSENFAVSFVGREEGYLRSTFSYARAAARLARQEAKDHDLLIEDFAPWNPLFTYRIRERPTIVQVQNRFGVQLLHRYPLAGWLFYGIERYYPRRFKHAIVLNEALNRTLKIQGEPISMGVDESLLTAPTTSGDYIASLGRLDIYQKGLDLLVEAARATRLPVQIAGDGPGRTRLEALLRATPNARWIGPLEGQAKVEFLGNARFVAIPSRFEGQNMVVLEGAALGKAVVVASVPELEYAVRNGFGLPFRTGAVPDLAAQLLRLWSDAALRQGLEERARPYVRGLTWPRITDQFEAYCLRVIQTSQGSAA